MFYSLYIYIFKQKLFLQKNQEFKFYKDLISGFPCNIVFDIGSNNGGKATHFSKIFKRIYLFEPSKNLCFF